MDAVRDWIGSSWPWITALVATALLLRWFFSWTLKSLGKVSVIANATDILLSLIFYKQLMPHSQANPAFPPIASALLLLQFDLAVVAAAMLLGKLCSTGPGQGWRNTTRRDWLAVGFIECAFVLTLWVLSLLRNHALGR